MSTSGQSRARRVGRGTGLVLAGAVGATALTGIAFAQPGPGDAGTATTVADDNGSQDTRPGPRHGFFGAPGTGPVLHGQDTVRTRDGGFATILTHNGELTAVSPTSITVKSEDGFTQTYAITADTKVRLDRESADASKLAAGRPVRVIANEDRSATLVASTTPEGEAAMAERRQKMRDKFQQWRQDGAAPSDGSPA